MVFFQIVWDLAFWQLWYKIELCPFSIVAFKKCPIWQTVVKFFVQKFQIPHTIFLNRNCIVIFLGA